MVGILDMETNETKNVDISWLDPSSAGTVVDRMIIDMAAVDDDPHSLSLAEIEKVEKEKSSKWTKLFGYTTSRALFNSLQSYLATRRISILPDGAAPPDDAWSSFHFYLSGEFSWKDKNDLLSALTFTFPEKSLDELMENSLASIPVQDLRKKTLSLLENMNDEQLIRLLERGNDFAARHRHEAIDIIVEQLSERKLRSERIGEALINIAMGEKKSRLELLKGQSEETYGIYEDVKGLLDVKNILKILKGKKRDVSLKKPPQKSWASRLIARTGSLGITSERTLNGLLSIVDDKGFDIYARAMAANSIGKYRHLDHADRERAVIAMMKFVKSFSTRTGDDREHMLVLAKMHALVCLGNLALTSVTDGKKKVDVLEFLGFHLYHTIHPRLRLSAVIGFAHIAMRNPSLTDSEIKNIGDSIRDAIGDPDEDVSRVATIQYRKFKKMYPGF